MRTRALVEQLRAQLGAADPLPPPPPAALITPPPKRVFPSPKRRSVMAQRAADHTTALVGIGRVGTRYATDVVLQFQAELAVAHGAVEAVLPEGWAASMGLLGVQSKVQDQHQHLLRPDLGRRLSPEGRALLEARAIKGADIQPILADGLSAIATQGAGMALLNAFMDQCRALGMSVGTPVGARFARVWLEDEIGEITGAKVSAILLGERPGLGTGDGLSAYLVYGPKVGRTDGDRNMMSNIHQRGTP
ncbi:ethanolamine ammonia-lyase subunit EutC, partial [Myxococcota bacterium]|nr:ethanolamine ammonia-lyase subunit EutC [Myxococcota bacterium]